jgi:GNAT superfamily N-acetyltransferase
VEIRPPSAREFIACRALVEPATRWVCPPAYLAAVADVPEHLLGGLAYTPIFHPAAPAWRLLVHVIPAYRRRAIATALLDALAAKAWDAGVRLLVARVKAAAAPDALPFLRARGFDQVSTTTTFELELERIEAELRPVLDRLEARGAAVAGERLVPLAEAPLDQVARLYTENLGGAIDGFEPALRNGLAQGLLGQSFVLLIDGQVRGLHLNEVRGDRARVHAKVVAPDCRGGRANALLALEFVGRMRALGVRRIRFAAAHHVRYTQRFATRCSARVVGVTVQLDRVLAEPGKGV